MINFPVAYKDRLVLLDFWATWCTPCRAEKPHLARAYQEYGPRGLEIIGISLDEPQGVSADRVRKFAQDEGMPWPQVYTLGAALASNYGVTGIPAAFLIDGNTGQILAQGDDLRGPALARTIEKHLKPSK